jgi:hypothetical protein
MKCLQHLMIAMVCAACGADAAAPAEGPTPIEASLALDLPMGDADSVLVGELRDATRLSDGRIAVLDDDRKAVLVLSSDGALLAAAGREGAGPGEFQWPAWLGRCQSDSLYVWDRGRSTVAIFSPDGVFSREFRPAVASPFQPECMPDGRFVALDASAAFNSPRATDTDTPRIHGALVLMSRTGDSLTAVPDLVLGQSRVIGEVAGMALTADGIVIGLNSSPEFLTFTSEGALRGRDTVQAVAAPFSEERYDAMVTRQAAATGGDSTVRRMLREMILSEGMPTHAPLFSSMHGSPDGTVWWVTSLPVDSATTMLGFRDGVPARSLDLPAGIEVFEIGADYLLGKRTDEEGFERLVLYRWGSR